MDVYDELIDRFGEPPAAVQGLIDVALLRNTAAACGIKEIREQGGTLYLYPRTLDMAAGARLTAALPGRVLISAAGKPYYAVKIETKGGGDSLDTLRQALDAMKEAKTDG